MSQELSTGEGTFNRALDIIVENRDRRLAGKSNCIPFRMPRLEKYVPGIERSQYTIVTANSGVGKSKITKLLYVLRAYEFIKENPDCGLKLKIFYFSLEEGREILIQSLISYELYRRHKIRVDVKELNSMYQDQVLDDDVIRKILDLQEYFREFENNCLTVYNMIRKPTQIYNNLVGYALKNGTMKDGVYTANNPEEIVIPIIDHISLIEPEKGQTLHNAIDMLSSRYLVELRNVFGMSPTVVQQQSSDKEKQVFTATGASVESKLEPSLDGLADNKKTQRDADMVLGLFAPDRYEIDKHRGYEVKRMQDSYRSLSVLKNRYGVSNLRVGLFFDGAVGEFIELPHVKEVDKMSKVFNLIDKNNGVSTS